MMSSRAAIRSTLTRARARLERLPHSADSVVAIAGQIRNAAHMCAQLPEVAGKSSATESSATGSPQHPRTPELKQAERLLLEAADKVNDGHRDSAVNKIGKAQQLLGG
jgi:hypothetical protein